MPFSVTISLSGLGASVGPFTLLSNATGTFIPFMTGVPKSSLATPSSLTVIVPDNTTIIRVQSTGTCSTFIDLFVIGGPLPPTTTTTTASGTTTTTTSSGPTTTTTTVSGPTTTTTTVSGPTTTTTTVSGPTTTTTTASGSTTTTTTSSETTTTSTSTSTTTTTSEPTTTTTSSSTTSTTLEPTTTTTGEPTTTTTVEPTTTTTGEPTTTTTSSTSTTTTVEPPVCNCYSLYNPGGSPEAPIGFDCNMNAIPAVPAGQTLYVCSYSTPAVIPFGLLIVTPIGDCASCPTTTTTTTVCPCIESVTVTVTGIGDITYDDCLGVPQTYTVESTGTITITNTVNCINRFTLAGTAFYSIDSYGPCCIPPTTTTTSTTLEPTTTTTTTECLNPCYETEYNISGDGTAEWFSCNQQSGPPNTIAVSTGVSSFCHDGSGVVFYNGASGTPIGTPTICGCNEPPPTTTTSTSTTTTLEPTTTTTITTLNPE